MNLRGLNIEKIHIMACGLVRLSNDAKDPDYQGNLGEAEAKVQEIINNLSKEV